MRHLAMVKYYAAEFVDYHSANADNLAIFLYSKADRLITKEGNYFYDP